MGSSDRRPRRRGAAVLVGTVLAAVLATPLAGQSPAAYRRAPGDTLRYRQLVEGKSESKGPQGGRSSESRREATVAFTFGDGDDARAWLEALTSTAKVQGQEFTAPAQGVLNQPFQLRVGANGAVQAPSGPSLPGPAGFTPQSLFAGFFLRLPDRPLAAGTEWADTIASKQQNPDGSKSESQYIVKYRVAGDTTVAGARAVVIAVKGEGTGKMTAPPSAVSVETRTRTSGTGRVVFSTELGRMLFLETTIESLGRTTTRGSGSSREDLGAIGSQGRNTGRVELGGAEARAAETRGRTHTLTELVPAQAKAAPAGQ